MDQDGLSLLRSYRDGRPRIWDATSLQPAVWRLAEQGLITLAPGREDAYVITDEGRMRLEERTGK